MKRTTWRGILAGVLVLLPTGLLHGAEQPPCVSFVLDCSKSMAAAIKSDDKIQNVAVAAGTSRFDAARDEVKKSLDKLSTDGNHRVAVWLFGHRLGWEQGKDQPDLQEQTAYLEQTLGFDALRDLLPGDDVEYIRPLLKMEPRDPGAINLRLDALKPWGECPLYLSLARAVDGMDKASREADRRIIVITCGSDHQGASKFTGSKAKVLESLEDHPVAIHIIRLGKEGDRQQETELSQIARESGGSYRRAETIEELAKRVDEALSDAPAAADAPAVATAPQTEHAASVKTVGIVSPVRSVRGTITFYREPVGKAEVVLENSATRRTATTDASGRFSFDNLAPGSFTLHVQASVKNQIHAQSKQVTIEPQADRAAIVEFDLE